MASVVHRIHELSARHAGRTALVQLRWDDVEHRYRRGGAVSYAGLHDRTLRLADALAARGLKAGDRVAVLLDTSVEMVVSEWACLVSGLIWVALNVRSSATEHAAILADCAPSVVLVASRYRDRIDPDAVPKDCRIVTVGTPGGAQSVRLDAGRPVSQNAAASRGHGAAQSAGDEGWDSLLAGGRPRIPAHAPGAEDPVRIRYTSGTAGQPKGAVLPRRCYDASMDVVSEVLGPLRADDVLAQVAPITHAAGAMWLPHAAVGATALLADRFDATAFLELAVRERVTAAFLVPTMLVRFLEAVAARAEAPAPASLRSIVYGGAAMPADRLERGLQLLGPVFVQIYGLTESNWPVTALRREDHLVEGPPESRRRRLASCGRPTSVGELRIVGRDGREAAAGEAGEVLVRGRNTMLGYWRKGRGDTKGLDGEGWMHTGDIAVRDDEGFVTIVDRLHDMIVSGGFNVYPREVEDALSHHPAVLEAAVVGRTDPEWGERVHAVVVLRPGAATSEAELAAHVAEHTAAYKKPRSFEFVAELPKNAAGKVLRRVLKTTTPPA